MKFIKIILTLFALCEISTVTVHAQESDWGGGMECENPKLMRVSVSLSDEKVVNGLDLRNEVERHLQERSVKTVTLKNDEEEDEPYLEVSVLTLEAGKKEFVYTIQITFNRPVIYPVGNNDDADMLQAVGTMYLDTMTDVGTYKAFQKSLHSMLDAFLKEYAEDNPN
jgi:hypothetical protein